MIEEEDLFKFNCEHIQPEDFITLLLVATDYNQSKINHTKMATDQKNARLNKLIQKHTDENDLLILA